MLACDGVWDVLKNEECVNFIEQKLQENKSAVMSDVCGLLLDRCIEKEDPQKVQGIGCDNMTAIIVQL